MVGRDSVEPTFERSEASVASISQRVGARGAAAYGHASRPEKIRARRSLALPRDWRSADDPSAPEPRFMERFLRIFVAPCALEPFIERAMGNEHVPVPAWTGHEPHGVQPARPQGCFRR